MTTFNINSANAWSKPLRWLCILPLLVVGLATVHAADSVWMNGGTLTTPPQIDATNVINTGIMSFSMPDLYTPFETSDTLNYTNSGTMISAPGWRFNLAPLNNGVRKPCANFVNLNGGLVEGVDGVAGFFIVGIPGSSATTPSYLWVSATNIVNKGTLVVGANGWMQLSGSNVNLSRSGVEVTQIQPLGSYNVSGSTNYWPETGIHDAWWEQTNMPFSTANLWNGTVASTPSHAVQAPFGSGAVSFSFRPTVADSYTNVLEWTTLTLTNLNKEPLPPTYPNPSPSDTKEVTMLVPSNVVKQAVFVVVKDPTLMGVGVRWHSGPDAFNAMKTAMVLLSVATTNVVSQATEYSQIYIYDELASSSGRGLVINSVSQQTFKPTNYIVSRVDDGRYLSGFTSQSGIPDNLFFYDAQTMTNRFVTNEYAAYNAQIDNIVSEPPAIPAGTVTNFPGRIRISADTLDLSRTRVRGEGEFVINAKHVLSTDNAVIDCQNLSYTLGSTNGLLSVQNLAKESVLRIKGNAYFWSAIWTNWMTVIYSNNYYLSNFVDTSVTPNTTNITALQIPVTNIVQVNYHVFMLDGEALASQLPVLVYDFITHSTNVVVNDNMSVIQSLLIDGESFTLNGGIMLSNTSFTSTIGLTATYGLYDWVYTNTPNLKNFTNNGSLFVPNNAHLGDDGPTAYTSFVNAGTINAGYISIKGAYFQNSGTLKANSGPVVMAGGAGKLEGGQTISAADSTFRCGSLKLANYSMTINGELDLDVTNALFDAGPLSANTLRVVNGFNLRNKPASGDLLGTSIQTSVPDFAEVIHTWAGLNRGAVAAGYTNNVALGKLIFGSVGIGGPLFTFTGATANSALYVDLLDLSNLGSSFQDLLAIEPSLTIYYAAVKIGFTPPVNAYGIAQSPEEYMDGQFGGHLRWVSSYAGAYSSTPVLMNGQTFQVNKALRNSKIIDSNGNGVPNYYDSTPFDAPAVQLAASLVRTNQPVSTALAISWTAAPSTAYQVLYSTSPTGPNWQTLTWYTNSAAVSAKTTIWDTNALGARRFYRVKQAP